MAKERHVYYCKECEFECIIITYDGFAPLCPYCPEDSCITCSHECNFKKLEEN